MARCNIKYAGMDAFIIEIINIVYKIEKRGLLFYLFYCFRLMYKRNNLYIRLKVIISLNQMIKFETE